MFFGGGEEEYGRKIFEKKILRRRRRIEKAKEQNNLWGTDNRSRTKAEQKKSRTLLYILPTLIRN